MKALKKWFPLISLICGALALVMIFLPCVESPTGSANGLEVAFGNKDEALVFSILHVLMYVLGVVGGALAFVGAKKGNNVMKYVAIACFAVAAILFFVNKSFVQWDTDYFTKAMQKEMNKVLDLAIGSILGGLACLVGAASAVCDVVVKE